MPFTWNAEDVPEDVRSMDDGAGGRRINPITQTIVFATITIGMPRITEANADEFYVRVHIWEKLRGAGTTDAQLNSIFVSPADVRAHIGVRTNARAMTTAQFRTFVYEEASRYARHSYDVSAELASQTPSEEDPA